MYKAAEIVQGTISGGLTHLVTVLAVTCRNPVDRESGKWMARERGRNTRLLDLAVFQPMAAAGLAEAGVVCLLPDHGAAWQHCEQQSALHQAAFPLKDHLDIKRRLLQTMVSGIFILLGRPTRMWNPDVYVVFRASKTS